MESVDRRRCAWAGSICRDGDRRNGLRRLWDGSQSLMAWVVCIGIAPVAMPGASVGIFEIPNVSTMILLLLVVSTSVAKNCDRPEGDL